MVKDNTLKSVVILGDEETIDKSSDGSRKVQSASKSLTLSTTNSHILGFKAMEYAARGPVILRALEIEKEIKEGQPKPFKEVIKANLGDAHAMGQRPITFLRQVLALVTCPSLIETSTFNEDVKDKARALLNACRGGSAGSYSDSRGLEIVRRHIAEYIQKRDNGIPSNKDDIVLSAGASEGIRACLKLFKENGNIDGKRSAVLIPSPEYPLYSATLEEYDMQKIIYYLDESDNWGLNLKEMEKAIQSARLVCNPRAIVIINPGNPTGHVLTRQNMEDIIRFAYRERLFLLADEVYQDNVYGDREFLSFKKVLTEMEAPFNGVELVSFYSCSKGYICECGLRGAYFEVVNMDPAVKSVLLASVAAKLCPTVLGQAAVDCSVDPPKPGDSSYDLFNQEKMNIINEFAERVELVTKVFNDIPGMSCSKVDGAMYAFPKVNLSEEAIRKAQSIGQEPDVFYALELLEATGICVVPGSGIGQVPGTFHFRVTILGSSESLKEMLRKFEDFQLQFLRKYPL